MLIDLVRHFFHRHKSPASNQEQRLKSLSIIETLQGESGARAAIPVLRKHLEQFPDDVIALNNLGCNLVDIGDNEGASHNFEQAFLLDDSYLPVIVNHGKFLGDGKRSNDAFRFLQQAKVIDPVFPHVDAVFAGQTLNQGKTELAVQHTLRAWLGAFDNLRFANCHLFYCSYHDIDELRLAAEHRFWGETLRPIDKIDDHPHPPPLEKITGKIRIGYWSPDFRNHSVRYFFRSLLENHDRSKFEVIAYHDFPTSDDHTKSIEKHSDHFFSVSDLSDEKLQKLLRSHQLDILVELAGHSSANRLNLLQERLATLQISGLGYPPTTGLSTIDAKILDTHIADSDSSRYYTESPMVLPSSFWCFDPKEETLVNPEPPVKRNGFITFACVGNVAKINLRILNCWLKILEQVPNSRLLLRSISFEDQAAQDYIAETLSNAGIPLERVDMYKPAGGKDYFDSYNEVDIILDTYPFNGGTTTCFATYMGVPVVSWAGKSLISRMGKSILSNLDMADWVVSNDEEYVARALAAAEDIAFLEKFRGDTRSRFAKTALGNSALFAREFEAACLELYAKKRQGIAPHRHLVEDLPADEIIRRAYTTLRTGQFEAAKRIINHCLKIYPDCGSAHILQTQELTSTGRFSEAANYLSEQVGRPPVSDKMAITINIVRNFLLSDELSKASAAAVQAKQWQCEDIYEQLQLQMLETCIEVRCKTPAAPFLLPTPYQQLHIEVCIICDDEKFFEVQKNKIEKLCHHPDGWIINLSRISETRKHRAFSRSLSQSAADILLWINKNISIENPNFFIDITEGLEHTDIIGIAGARKWDRLDWRLSPPENKAASFLAPSSEKPQTYELQTMGSNRSRLAHGMSILEGSLVAIHRRIISKLSNDIFDSLLDGGAALMEEDFTHQAYLAGAHLSVHQALGVCMDWQTILLDTHLGEARWHIAQRQGFEPFAPKKDNRTIISVPVNNLEEGIAVQRLFLKD